MEVSMDPEKTTALSYLKGIYRNTIRSYDSATTPICQKGEVPFWADRLIKYALRVQFYREVESAHYLFSGHQILNALLTLGVYDEKRYNSSQCDDSDDGDSFLCAEHIENYRKELRSEARKKSKSKKEK